MKKATASPKDDALKLSLEVLQLVSIEFVCNGAHHAKKDRHDWLESCPIVERYQAAITAIKEALAPTSTQCEVQDEQSSSQEPVAINQHRIPYCADWYDGIPDHHDGHGPYEVRTLYTTPPKEQRSCDKRPWVGLTDERMWELWNSQGDDAMEQQAAIAFAQDIDAKLKELNT